MQFALLVIGLDDDIGKDRAGDDEFAPTTKPFAFFFSSSMNFTLLSHNASRIRCIAGGMSFSVTYVSGPAHLTRSELCRNTSLSLMRFFR